MTTRTITVLYCCDGHGPWDPKRYSRCEECKHSFCSLCTVSEIPEETRYQSLPVYYSPPISINTAYRISGKAIISNQTAAWPTTLHHSRTRFQGSISANYGGFNQAGTLWVCHSCGSGPWLLATTIACLNCGHPACSTCSSEEVKDVILLLYFFL
jgi:hypothetical protein